MQWNREIVNVPSLDKAMSDGALSNEIYATCPQQGGWN